MTKYVKRDGRWVNKSTGEEMLTPEEEAAPITMPMIISDIPEYTSPIDGKLITSRSQRRDDLARNNCVDARDFPSATGGKYRNKAFCEKRGLQVSEEYR